MSHKFKSKMADGRHIENSILATSRCHIDRLMWISECRWRITCRYRSRDQNGNFHKFKMAAVKIPLKVLGSGSLLVTHSTSKIHQNSSTIIIVWVILRSGQTVRPQTHEGSSFGGVCRTERSMDVYAIAFAWCTNIFLCMSHSVIAQSKPNVDYRRFPWFCMHERHFADR